MIAVRRPGLWLLPPWVTRHALLDGGERVAADHDPGLVAAADRRVPDQLADLVGDLASGLASHMTAIRTAVVADADRDAAVPAPVVVLVDRGPQVGVAAARRTRRVLLRRRWCHWWLPSFAAAQRGHVLGQALGAADPP